MRLLIIDPLGVALDLAIRAQKDGHQVKHFIRQTEKTKCIGRGFVEIVDDFKPWLRWSELVFNADNTLYLRDLDAARKEGVNVMGASTEAAQWELDRGVGQEILRKHGVSVVPSRTFSDYDKAIAYVKKENCRLVSKPSGDANKALSYVAKTPADMVFMLERWKKLGKLKSPFILQEFVEGVEMAVGGWFGPGGWNQGWCENFEFKKLMNDDLGVATGEQGTVLRYVKTSKLARKMLLPLTEHLERLNYCGYVDVNCIIDTEGTAWPLEFTMRPGWPTFQIQQELHEGDCVEWMMNLSQGVDSRNTLLDVISAGVVMSIPDYPYSHITRKEVTGIPIYGISAPLWDHLHPCEMMMADKVPCEVENGIAYLPTPVTAGDYVLVMSASAGTVSGATRMAYRRLGALIVPNSPMYRTDIGKRLKKQLPLIQSHGYATGMNYQTEQVS